MGLDIITLSIIQKALENIAEEMGVVLRRASFSANCKERLDFSCAIFNHHGELVAQAEHIPVHLGAMFSSMEIILEKFSIDSFFPGDIVILNSPYTGGTHLPDVSSLSFRLLHPGTFRLRPNVAIIDEFPPPSFYLGDIRHHHPQGRGDDRRSAQTHPFRP